MPISKYFKGHGNEVMSNMKKEYGPKAKQVFYATAQKNGGKPKKDSEEDDRKRAYHEALDLVMDTMEIRAFMKDLGI